MQDVQSIDDYFTEQVVGKAFAVSMGPSTAVQEHPGRGVLVRSLASARDVALLAAGSAWNAPADVVAGTPISLRGLARWRRWLLVLAWAAWTAAMWLALSHRG